MAEIKNPVIIMNAEGLRMFIQAIQGGKIPADIEDDLSSEIANDYIRQQSTVSTGEVTKVREYIDLTPNGRSRTSRDEQRERTIAEVDAVEEILSACAPEPMRAVDIAARMNELGFEWKRNSITGMMEKVTKYSDSIKKVDKGLYVFVGGGDA